MGDTDALRDKMTNVLREVLREHTPKDADLNDAFRDDLLAEQLADAVLPVVTQETAQALSSLRSRVEALADELDNEVQTITNRDAGALGRRGALRDAAQRLRRSLSDNKEQQ